MRTMAANSVSQKLVQSLDLSNTVLGGMSQARFSEYETDQLFTIQITTPGLNEYNYEVEIRNNVLHIFTCFVNVEGYRTPYMMRYFTLPHYVDVTGAYANFTDNGTLCISFPILQDLKNFKAHLPID